MLPTVRGLIDWPAIFFWPGWRSNGANPDRIAQAIALSARCQKAVVLPYFAALRTAFLARSLALAQAVPPMRLRSGGVSVLAR